MRLYFKGTYRACIANFHNHNDETRRKLDEIYAYNSSLAGKLFDMLMGGEADYAYFTTKDKTRRIIFTRSVRGDWIQRSCIWLKGNEWIPLSHCDCMDWKQLEREIDSRCYVNVCKV